MSGSLNHLFFNGTDRDPINGRNIALFHIFHSKQYEDIPRSLVELRQRAEHLLEALSSQ